MSDTPQLRVLLVDDDAAARRMMRRVLERRGGYLVDEVGDGRSGLDAARADPPAILLLDLRMPGELSGVEVARALKGDPETASIPIVVVSASAHYDAKELTRRVGCDGFVEKPVDFDLLFSEMNRVLSPE